MANGETMNFNLLIQTNILSLNLIKLNVESFKFCTNIGKIFLLIQVNTSFYSVQAL